MTCVDTLDVSDVVTDLLDGLHLLLKVVSLKKVRHLHQTEKQDDSVMARPRKRAPMEAECNLNGNE